MTIGIIILCAAILMIFFGLLERFFRRIGIANWLAFLIVLALVIGAVIPNITIGEYFLMNVSGFLIPIAVMLVFFVLIGFNWELTRSILSLISIAAVVVAVRIIMPDNTAAMIITTSVIIGFLCGTVAYLIAQSRMAIIASTMGGIVLGDVIMSLLDYNLYGAKTISLGTGGVFNSIILALVFGLILHEAISAMIRATSRRRLNSQTLSFEAGEDFEKTQIEDKHDNKKEKNSNEDELTEEFNDYNNYFEQ